MTYEMLVRLAILAYAACIIGACVRGWRDMEAERKVTLNGGCD